MQKLFRGHRGRTRGFLPEELSAFLLGHLKNVAEAKLGRSVGAAVVTVPAYFNHSQRLATRSAKEGCCHRAWPCPRAVWGCGSSTAELGAAVGARPITGRVPVGVPVFRYEGGTCMDAASSSDKSFHTRRRY